MSVDRIHTQEIVGRLAHSLRAEAGDGCDVAVRLISQAIRRASHILAPSSQSELRASALKSLLGVGLDDDALPDLVERTLEDLLTFGEILELRGANQDAWERSKFVLRPAPPSFIMHANGMAIIVGVAGDDLTPLPSDAISRVRWQGVLRCVDPDDGEDVRTWLRELGLLELPESAWLRLPNAEDPVAYLAKWRNQFSQQSRSGDVDGLTILGERSANGYYAGRWTDSLETRSGLHVARRPQRYGSPIWCLAELEAGRCVTFLDLTSVGDRVRPCDVAWRIQMALDAAAGTPQTYRAIQRDADTVIAFSAPVPSWAERKLAIVGVKAARAGSLYTYQLPHHATPAAEKFLRELLWLAREEN